MNGTESALVEYAKRSAENAHRAQEYALQAQQSTSRMEREQAELRRTIEKLGREMRAGFEALNTVIMQPQRRELHSITEEDFVLSDTGNHARVTIDTVKRVLRKDTTLRQARNWRKALNASGKVALGLVLVVLGWLARHLLGKP